MLAPEVFWDPLPQTVKDALAERILSYGDNETIEMNWRFFNINIMSFFKSRGYKTNDAYLEYLVRRSLEDYRSHGWYSDSPYFDYYSMWAFQMYGTIWAKCFGEEYYPQYAKEFLDHLSEIPANYTHMFGRNGKMIMWGRSIIYRMGAAIPLALTGMLNDADYNYGWMRYITSSTILQFLQHPDFLKDGIPTLGFYGAFEPAVQLYSCRGSVFWLGKLFLALYMPENNPFWQEKENLGDWNTYNNDVQNIYADQANILISDFPNIGAAEIRSTASSVNIGIYHGTENYNRLSYNSEFPWQADGKNGEVAMNYVFKNAKNEWEAIRIYKFKKYENGFYCRDACLASDHENVKLVLTELPIENGILRIDMIKTPKPISVRFGHYALPIKKQAPNTKKTKIDNHDTFVVDNGEYKLGMINWNGWDEMEFVKSKGLHPETEESIVIDAESEVLYERLFISVLLFDKASNRLDCPIKDIKYSRNSKKVVVLFKNGTEKEVTLW